MKIDYTPGPDKIAVAKIAPGDVFEDHQHLYLKMEDDIAIHAEGEIRKVNAWDLCECTHQWVNPHELVSLRPATLKVTY